MSFFKANYVWWDQKDKVYKLGHELFISTDKVLRFEVQQDNSPVPKMHKLFGRTIYIVNIVNDNDGYSLKVVSPYLDSIVMEAK
jgi:hypothetical protein